MTPPETGGKDHFVAAALRFLREGDRAGLWEVAKAFPPDVTHDNPGLVAVLVSAMDQGATTAGSYALAIAVLDEDGRKHVRRSEHPAVVALAEHVWHQPERLSAVLDAVVEGAPQLSLPFLARVLRPTWKGDPSPAIPFLLRVAGAEESPLLQSVRVALDSGRRHAEEILFSIGALRDVDLTSMVPSLEAALADSRTARAAAFLLAARLLAAETVAWPDVDRLAGHERPSVRVGASRALVAAWLEGRHTERISTRLAAALDDPSSPPLREEAHEALFEGARRGFRLGDLDPEGLARLIAALTDAAKAEAIAQFLDHYLLSSDERARAVIAALTASEGATPAAAEELARRCQERLAGRYAPCSLCRFLGPDAWWGDEMERSRPHPPPEVARLEALPGDAYRCPRCGAYFDRKTRGGSFMNNDWDAYWLERRPASVDGETGDPVTRVHEGVRTGKLAGLRPALVDGRGNPRREAWDALRAHVLGGLDVSALEPMLAEMLAVASPSNTPELRSTAAGILTLHLLRGGRHKQVLALLSDRDDPIRSGAMGGVWHAAAGFADVRPVLDRTRQLLGDPDEGVRYSASGALKRAGVSVPEKERGRRMAATGLRALKSERPEAQREAAWLLSDAEIAGGNVGAAVPRLAALLTDAVAGSAAETALFAAAHQADLTAVLPDLGRLVAQGGKVALDAASILTCYHLHRKDWDRLRELLERQTDEVSERCARELGSFAQEHDLAPLVPVLERVARGERPAARAAAEGALKANRDWATCRRPPRRRSRRRRPKGRDS